VGEAPYAVSGEGMGRMWVEGPTVCGRGIDSRWWREGPTVGGGIVGGEWGKVGRW